MSDYELAVKYSPHIMFDVTDPFSIDAMGYTVFREPGPSPSFRRNIAFDTDKVAFAVEYAVFFDFDIQHMYDLEHVWIYISHDGHVCDAEGSFHGSYFKAMILEDFVIKEGTHFQIFCQPGKHAFMPDGNYFKLLPDWYGACNEHSGRHGLLINHMFEDKMTTTPELQEKIGKYISSNFAFNPTLTFEHRALSNEIFIPWTELMEVIPARMNKQIEIIKAWSEN